VQDWALKTLIVWEMSQERRRLFSQRYDQVRASLLAIDPAADPSVMKRYRQLYPEFMPKREEVVITQVSEVELFDTTGDWDFEQSVTSHEEIEEVLRNLGQNFTMTLDDVPDDDEGWM
jgi:hypothetical protein